MSIRTEFKQGDRVHVDYAVYGGNATVVGGPVQVRGFVNPSYVLLYDDKVSPHVDVVYYGALSLLEPATPKPRYTLDELHLIVDRTSGVCRCADLMLSKNNCGSCAARRQYAELTPAEITTIAPYVAGKKPSVNLGTLCVDRETEPKAERNPYNLLLDTSVVEELSDALKEAKKRLASAPEPIADAFIDKVADRVAAKVKAARQITYAPTIVADSVFSAEKLSAHFEKFKESVRRKEAAESRYVTATDKQSIKAALAAGKIVNAPHKSGKTTAILELLRENPGKYVAVYNDLDAELGARQRNYYLFGAYPDEHDTDNIHRSGQNNGTRLVIAEDCPDSALTNLFASVFTR